MNGYGRWWGGIALGAGILVLLAIVASLAGATGVSAATQAATPTPTPTTVPFLRAPFAGTYRVTSYVDHQTPAYDWDDTIVIFNGDQASAIDGIFGRSPTFRGGYWFPDTYWYIYYDGHNGVDYGTGAGTTLLAAAPGRVHFAGIIPSSCATPLQYVSIDHENDYRTYYLHLEGICVQAGQWVEAGDPLGISGNSGCSLGPHLHFGVEHEGWATDPYGWRPVDRPDPLIEYSGERATWLWLPEEPPLPTGRLTQPPGDARTNGNLHVVFEPDRRSPPVARVTFMAYYADAWHRLGTDENGTDGWQFTWDTRRAPEGKAWLHAWVEGTDDRVNKGIPIRTGITVDRHAPLGYTVGLEPWSTAAGHVWLYAASYDPDSTTERVTFLVRESGTAEWREVGDAVWLHSSNWLLEWEPGAADGARIDIAARLVDGAGNTTLTQPIEGVTVDRTMPAGEVVSPTSGTPITGPLDLVYAPFPESAPPWRVAFHVWHDGAWHEAGVDSDASDGWSVRWDPRYVEDQARVRVQARPYDRAGRANTALSQVTALTLDRTPPSAGYTRPRTGGVSRPGVELRVWAWDGHSGVERVEFYVNEGPGWLKVGEDRSARDGWTLSWDAHEIPDGLVAFSARVYDQAGNEMWTEDEVDVALDREPPEGVWLAPPSGMQVSGTVTLTLDVTDTVSGLDRAVFYARYGRRWHHVGADVEPDDGLSVAWDTAAVGAWDDVTLTAWVYDRAGNHAELPYVEALAVGGSLVVTPDAVPPPTRTSRLSLATPTQAAPPTQAPTQMPTPTPLPPTETATMIASPTSLPTATPQPAATRAATAAPAVVAVPTPLATPAPAAEAQVTPAVLASVSGWPVPPLFWYLVGAGGAIGVVLLVLSVRDLRGGRVV